MSHHRRIITDDDVCQALSQGRTALEVAQRVREEQRRKHRPDRMSELARALTAIKNANRALRSLTMASTYRHVPREPELRGLSASLQSERRKLWKMMQRTTGIGGLEGGWS